MYDISAMNPPPVCLTVPTPIPAIDFCVKLYNIHTPGQNLHVCVDFETRFFNTPILVLRFDCVQMGLDGVNVVKPNQTHTSQQASSTESIVIDSDVYNEVTEIKYIKPTLKLTTWFIWHLWKDNHYKEMKNSKGALQRNLLIYWKLKCCKK